MKHILSILFLAITLSSVANAQECKVPISIQLGNTPSNTVRQRHDILGASFMSFLEHRGFTTEVHNTRIAINLLIKMSNELCMGENYKMEVEIKFIDAFTGAVFYTTQLDRFYCGNITETRNELAGDFASNLPELDSLADSIRISIIDAFEFNTRHMAEVAHHYATQGDHDIALFALVQYPSCCPSFPKIRDFTVAIFRDYMRKDHEAMLDVAKSVWKYAESDTDARFVVSLLNSVTLNEKEQKKADKLLKKIAKHYPSLDLKAKEDYTFVSELKAIAYSEARTIGIDYSTSEEILPETENFIPSAYRRRIRSEQDYDNHHDPYYHDYDFNDSWFPIMMNTYMQL